MTRKPLIFLATAGVIFTAHAIQTEALFIPLSIARFLAIITAAAMGYALLQTPGWRGTPGIWIRFTSFVLFLYLPVLALGFVFFGAAIQAILGLWMFAVILALVALFAAGQILLGATLAGIVETGGIPLREGYRRAKSHARFTARALVFGPWVVNALVAGVKLASHQAGLPNQPFDPVTGAFLWAWLPVNALQAFGVIFAALLTVSILHHAWAQGQQS